MSWSSLSAKDTQRMMRLKKASRPKMVPSPPRQSDSLIKAPAKRAMAWCNFDDYNTSDDDLLTTECMNELQWSRAFFVEFESIMIAKRSDHMDAIVRS